MNPQAEFCPNEKCPDRGKVGAGNIVCHSQQEKRCKCSTCGKTFSITKGTAVYGIKKAHELFWIVVTLLGFGCPTQAIVKAFGLDERTVREWYRKSGEHGQQVHEHVVGQSQLDLGQVQADEIKVKSQIGTIWMAMAMMVSTRLWLGGAVSRHRDKHLIRAVAGQIRCVALCRPLLLAVDGLVTYIKAFQKAFCTPLKEGKVGRPRLIAWQGISIVQVIKRYTAKQLSVERRIVQGDATRVEHGLHISQGGGQINTAFIERLNATFRQHLAALARRTRCLARQVQTLHTGMFLVGSVYNFCTTHDSLKVPLWISERHCHWVQRTPAMAAGLTDHCWTTEELLTFKIPLTPYVPPKKRGRPRKQVLLEAIA